MTGTIIICLVIAILAAIAIWLVESIALRHVSTPHYPKPPKKGEPCERALVLTKTDYARMQPRGRFCLIGWGAAAVEGLIFPVVCLYYLPPLIVSYIVMKVNRRPGRALRGTDAALSLELIATLIVIPVVGLIATVGTSTSFYLLSAAQTSTIPGPLYLGWLFLAGTVVISAELVWLMVRVYTRHNSGQDVWFFQADAKPGLAIDRLLESRACRASGFLPGRFIQAAQWADNHVDTDEDSNDYLKFKEAICLLLAHRTTRRQPAYRRVLYGPRADLDLVQQHEPSVQHRGPRRLHRRNIHRFPRRCGRPADGRRRPTTSPEETGPSHALPTASATHTDRHDRRRA